MFMVIKVPSKGIIDNHISFVCITNIRRYHNIYSYASYFWFVLMVGIKEINVLPVPHACLFESYNTNKIKPVK